MSAATVDLYRQFVAANAKDEAIPVGQHPSEIAAWILVQGVRRGEADKAKRLANLKAHAALHGITLNVTDSDSGRPVYVLSEHAHTKALDTLEDVASWLTRRTGSGA